MLISNKGSRRSEMSSSSNVIASSSGNPSTNGLANTELFYTEPELVATLHTLSNDELYSFAQLHEDPISDVQIELYSLAYFLLFARTLSEEYLKQAVQRIEGWVAVTNLNNPDRARRLQLLDMMSARMCEHTYISKELLPALIEEG